MTGANTSNVQRSQEQMLSTWASGYWQDAHLGFSRWGRLEGSDGSRQRWSLFRNGLVGTALAAALVGLLWSLGRWLLQGKVEPLGGLCLLVAVLAGVVLHGYRQQQELVAELSGLMQAGQLEEAIQGADKALSQTRSNSLRALLVELQARAWVGCAEPLQAHLALQRMPPGRLPSLALRGALLLYEGEAEEAVRVLSQALARRQDDGVASILCAAYLMSELPKEACSVVLGRRTVGRPLYSQLQAALIDAGAYALAIQVGEEAFVRFNNVDDAYHVACSYCRAKQRVADDWKEQACSWLQRAAKTGVLDVEALLHDSELEPVHDHEAFRSLVAQLRAEGDRAALMY